MLTDKRNLRFSNLLYVYSVLLEYPEQPGSGILVKTEELIGQLTDQHRALGIISV